MDFYCTITRDRLSIPQTAIAPQKQSNSDRLSIPQPAIFYSSKMEGNAITTSVKLFRDLLYHSHFD
ncbi:hypothetical protein VB774_02610 [Pseudanabaena galeata UHCC 0370]|uniref:Uncharacterized protein n=1 Tax=Pseudanabaena galeata UHCC 0370 TaxID=3110310 RepID=A0ABU5TE06_9CYAN|nr:hypothetical protein [Pseudanabaena galeata]MEA5476501.1 hypothetical protein [Pseudanabaena galeata UHCC 0370]